MKDVDGKVAVVTGAASGIGEAMARRFAAAGMKVVLADVDEARLASVASSIPGALAVPTDVARAADVTRLADEAERAFGAVHVVCNNAGIGGAGGPLWTISEEDLRRTIDVNLWSVWHGIRVFVPRMLARGGEGHIVNTASMAGLTAPPMMGAYAATKHAVVAMSEVLAKDLQLAGAALRVSVLCPGWVRTRIADGALGPIQKLVADGIAPAAVADRVLEAIREERFYILTHPELVPAIAERMKDLLEPRNPKVDEAFVRMFASSSG
jgi:NAD(P)-dependent dehydrogenase (short-subunit alcohol dehydrogenase family)